MKRKGLGPGKPRGPRYIEFSDNTPAAAATWPQLGNDGRCFWCGEAKPRPGHECPIARGAKRAYPPR